MNDIYTGLIN